MGFALARAADCVRRTTPDPDRKRQARRGAVLGRRQSLARLKRRQGAGGPRAASARLRLLAHRRSREGAGSGDLYHRRFREGPRDRGRRQEIVARDVVGLESKYSLYDDALVTFEEGAVAYDHRDAAGFIKLNALRLRTLGQRKKKLGL